jgi:hypothetical protein
MRRSSLVFLTASLLVHAGTFGAGTLIAKRAAEKKVEPRVTFAGETFEIANDDDPKPEAIADDEIVQKRAAPEENAVVARPHAHIATRGDDAHHESVEAPLTYGALGDRSAVDVTVAVARGFPQAASTDPIWRTTPLGDAGSATLEIELESDGTLARWSLGPGASMALRQAFVRTMAFIGGRTFLAHEATTKLHVSARVTTDAVHDGGDAVYAIHAEHEGDHANAYFSLSSGRRIDLVITHAK